MDNFSVSQGSALYIDVTLRDSSGAVISTYDGTETLTTKVWPGGKTPATFTPTTVWVTPGSGTIEIQCTPDQTAAALPYRYECRLRLTDAGSPVDAYECTIEILATATT